MCELAGKRLAALGDSLIKGNHLPRGSSWVELLGRQENMIVYNHGINGNTVAMVQGNSTPMCRRYREMEDGMDYVVVLGGANDKRLNVPLGDTDSRDEKTFIGALRILAEGLREKYPHARILFMTNYRRYSGSNRLGLSEVDYVDAMLAVAAEYAIACFDNYRLSGIDFADPAQVAWIDEGISLGEEPNRHFSAEAYRWLLPKYIQLLKAL